MKDTLHIFGQEYSHDDVYIIGDEEALFRLKENIELLLNQTSKKVISSTHFPNDGEGYKLYVILEKDMEKVQIPYSSDMFVHTYKQIHPASIVCEKERKQTKINEVVAKMFSTNETNALDEICEFVLDKCLFPESDTDVLPVADWDLLINFFESLCEIDLTKVTSSTLLAPLSFSAQATKVLILKPSREKYYNLVEEEFRNRGFDEQRIKNLLQGLKEE